MEAIKPRIDNSRIMQLPDILHCIRVAGLASKVCSAMGIEAKERENIIIAAILHDIGKSEIEKEILNKPGKLNNNEWNYMKLHSEFGAYIASIAGLEGSIVKNILYHHEDYDGKGYPKKAKGEEIPLGAAIIRVCDTYDALTTKRPYKEEFTHSEAINEMLKNKEKYNPDVLSSFMNIKLKDEYKEEIK